MSESFDDTSPEGPQSFRGKRPRLLIGGLQLASRKWPCVVWIYLVNLTFALLAGIPFTTGLSRYLDHSLAAQQISGGLDAAYLRELAVLLGRDYSDRIAINSAFGLTLVEFAVLLLLSAGTVYIYVTNRPAKLSVLLRGGSEYFWRFLGIFLSAAIFAGALLAAVLAGREAVLLHVAHLPTGRAVFFSTAAIGLVLLLVALLLRLGFDLVEVYAVCNGTLGDHGLTGMFMSAIRLLGRKFFRAFGSFLLAAVLGIGALLACLFAWKDFVSANQVWAAFLISQLGLFLLLASRLWQRGIEITLVLASMEPPAARTAALEDMAAASALPGRPEPTLQELVQKLRSEPWANPEGRPPLPQPNASAAATKVTTPHISLLTEHEKKVPLQALAAQENITSAESSQTDPDAISPEKPAPGQPKGGPESSQPS